MTRLVFVLILLGLLYFTIPVMAEDMYLTRIDIKSQEDVNTLAISGINVYAKTSIFYLAKTSKEHRDLLTEKGASFQILDAEPMPGMYYFVYAKGNEDIEPYLSQIETKADVLTWENNWALIKGNKFNIEKLPSRSGVRGSLDNGKTTDNYIKFLKFRDLIETEVGIRAEAPDQTAMTTLWRKRKAILGLVGGVCKVCGTPQFPKMDICVNPDCGAVDEMEDYRFSDKRGTLFSYTEDHASFSPNPPLIFGMIDFEDGGRFLFDVTDCEPGLVSMGMPVKMSFRRKYSDEFRGINGYFWKAVPVRE